MSQRIEHFETTDIRLRLFRQSDESELAKIANNYKIAKWLPKSFPHPYTQEDAKQWIQTNTTPNSWHRAITYKHNLAGSIGVNPVDEGYASFGFWVAEKYWGNKVATTAGKRYLDRFEKRITTKFERLTSWHLRDNKKSEHLLQKLGFQQFDTEITDVRGIDRVIKKYHYEFQDN